jgi:allophanate hydrolase
MAAGAPLRVGIPRADVLEALDGASRTAWARAVQDAAAVAEAVVEIDLKPFLSAGRLLYHGAWLAERHAAIGDALARCDSDADPVVHAIVAEGSGWTAAEVLRGHEELARHRARADHAWRAADVVLVPTAPTLPSHDEVEADPVGVNDRLGTFTTFANLLDLCAVAVPSGLRPDGLPFGVTLLGRAGDDAALLDLAARWPWEAGRAGPPTRWE